MYKRQTINNKKTDNTKSSVSSNVDSAIKNYKSTISSSYEMETEGFKDIVGKVYNKVKQGVKDFINRPIMKKNIDAKTHQKMIQNKGRATDDKGNVYDNRY